MGEGGGCVWWEGLGDGAMEEGDEGEGEWVEAMGEGQGSGFVEEGGEGDGDGE